ncbi:hypothetical protein BT63DRAFT_476242 [Microthyrium microscopicum]|uniref:CENP-V/GFA domain-containing protein n=1 Tax=Microthyrium microscopicum TaxID=703497 RepID=A0A6A6UQU6_9PEZI|nr:hypothetical protein BT63DRAFT_476242 [Microthyrium microscopicum]
MTEPISPRIVCQCAAISVPLPSGPLKVYHCHCQQCRRQSGSAYGTSAIFPATVLLPLSPSLSAKLGKWTRPTDSGGSMDCYFCKICANRIMHHGRTGDGKEKATLSVKGGLVEGLDWKGAAHIHTRRGVVKVPEGVESWEGEPDD